MKRIFFFISLILGLVACADDDSFSTSTGLRLDFPSDTIKLDTVFSRTASSTYTFWVNNRNDNGVKLQSVRLKRGNQTGFRVNVDGMYLDNNNGSQTNDVEIRKNDSVLVVVEITPYETYQTAPKEITDELVFLMESGTEQSVCLKAWAWDAIKCEQPVIERDSVAGMEVYGTLHTDNCTMRGDRLDRMFSYLPYDRVPGQWKGIRFYNTSNNNVLNTTQIRNPNQGLICDSAAIDSVSYRLKMQQCVVHNCQGDGVKLTNAHVRLENCQLTNAMGDCLNINGGMVEIVYCTLAQFYPFTGGRGAALRFTNQTSPLYHMMCEGTIITGYDDDVLIGEQAKDSAAFNYTFAHSLLRTPKIDDTAHFNDIIWESPNDEIQGKAHFIKIDEDNLDYDFHLDALSTAAGLGCYR